MIAITDETLDILTCTLDGFRTTRQCDLVITVSFLVSGADYGQRTLLREAEEALRCSSRTTPSKVQRRGWHQVWKPRVQEKLCPWITL